MSHKSFKLQTRNFRETLNTTIENPPRPTGAIWDFGFCASLKVPVWTFKFLASLLLSGPSVLAADLTPAQTQFFENRIRPLLAENCYKCHSQQAEKVKGGLLLDTKEGLLKGGEN